MRSLNVRQSAEGAPTVAESGRLGRKGNVSRGVKLKTVSMTVLIFAFLCLGAFMAGRPPDATYGATSEAGASSGFGGLQTVVYRVNDLHKAVAWYAMALGRKPFIDGPDYAGFRIGNCELGIVPAEKRAVRYAPTSVSYWKVNDANAVYEHLVKLGAEANEPLRYADDGTLAGSVRDPFGNLIGLVQITNELDRGD